MTNAKAGTGITMTIAGNAVAEIKDITPPDPTTKTIDVTNHASPNGDMEYILGLRDGGKVTVKGNFYPGDVNGQIVLANARSNRTLLSNVIIAFPPSIGCSWTFNALVVKFQITSPLDKEVSFTAEMQITGTPVLGVTGSGNLDSLTISIGTLSPAWAATLYEFDDVLTNGTTSVTVTPADASAQSITVNGATVTSGSASGAIPTPVGVTTITIINTDAGKAPTVTVIHAARTS